MSRYSDYKYAVDKLREIENRPDKFLIIHYSCESFFNLNGKSPRIVSISVRRFDNAQTTNFSIHEISEVKNRPDIIGNYKELEKLLLQNFFNFVNDNKDKTWVHWNMRDSNYGFNAIEHRFEVLGGKPTQINDSNKIDLGFLFKKLYGEGYIGNPHITELMILNEFDPRNLLSGKEEAEYFDKNKFVELSLSTSAKVNLFSSFLTSAIDKKLKVKTPKWKIRGDNLIGLYALIQENPISNFIVWILNLIIGGIVGALISNLIQ